MADKTLGEVGLKSTKQEILEAYESVKKELENKEKQSLNADKKIEEKKQVETIKASDAVISQGAFDKINSLKSEITKSLDDLSLKLAQSAIDYKNVKDAIDIKDKDLKEIYGIEHSALSLASLIEANSIKTESLEREYSVKNDLLKAELDDLKNKIDIEKKSYENLTKEKEAEFKLFWDRKKEEAEYAFKRESEQKLNELNDDLKALRRSIDEEREKFQKEIVDKNKELEIRENNISEKEKFSKELAEKVSTFPAKLELEVSGAIKTTTERLKSDFELEKELIRKEYEGKINVLSTKIDSLEKIISEQEKRVSILTTQQEKAYAQVQQIAISAVQGSLDKNSQNKLEQILDKISKIQVAEK